MLAARLTLEYVLKPRLILLRPSVPFLFLLGIIPHAHFLALSIPRLGRDHVRDLAVEVLMHAEPTQSLDIIQLLVIETADVHFLDKRYITCASTLEDGLVHTKYHCSKILILYPR